MRKKRFHAFRVANIQSFHFIGEDEIIRLLIYFLVRPRRPSDFDQYLKKTNYIHRTTIGFHEFSTFSINMYGRN